MWFVRIFGLIAFICGVGLFMVSVYIKGQVIAGRGQISDAQDKVDVGTSIFSLNKNTKPVGDEISSGANKKLDEKRSEANQYDTIANQTKIAGIVLMMAGGAAVAYALIKKRSKN